MEGNVFNELAMRLRAEAAGQLPTMCRYGKVISTEPLRIEVAQIIHEKEVFMKDYNLPELMVGDRCLLIPMESEQRYIIVCKVVEL